MSPTPTQELAQAIAEQYYSQLLEQRISLPFISIQWTGPGQGMASRFEEPGIYTHPRDLQRLLEKLKTQAPKELWTVKDHTEAISAWYKGITIHTRHIVPRNEVWLISKTEVLIVTLPPEETS